MGTKFSHLSHGMGPHVTGHAGSTIATDGAPKNIRVTTIHGGMTRQVQGQPITGGGHDASALDSLSGRAVVPGNVKSTPGFGNSGVQSGGSPLARPPGGKNLARVAPAFGSKKVSGDLHELGNAVLAQAFKASHSGDRFAHGRKPDGTK